MLDTLRILTPLAPLHLPHSLDAIDALRTAWPGLPQIAVFDTAFHRTLPHTEQLLPLPHAWFEKGVRRYGFHGLSYEYLTVAPDEAFGAHAHGRVIAAIWAAERAFARCEIFAALRPRWDFPRSTA